MFCLLLVWILGVFVAVLFLLFYVCFLSELSRINFIPSVMKKESPMQNE